MTTEAIDRLDTHAHALLHARGLDASESSLAYAERRVLAAGRLAELGARLIPGVVRVRTVEHGEPDAMGAGCIMAEVWLDAATMPEWQALAGRVLALEELAAKQGLRLMLAVWRASRWDRLRERWTWWRR